MSVSLARGLRLTALLVAALAAFAQSQSQPQPQPGVDADTAREPAPGAVVSHMGSAPPEALTEAALSDLRERVNRATTQGRHVDILRLIDTPTRLPDGSSQSRWAAIYYGEALSHVIYGDEAWRAMQRQLERLAEQQPHAWILVAHAHVAQAWQARGDGMAGSVTPAQQARFQALLGQAAKTLDQHKAELAEMPEWYALRLHLATEAGEPESARRRWFVEGVLRHPANQGIYFARMRQLTPKWGGSEPAMFDLLDDIARSDDPAVLAEGLYARVLFFAEREGYPLVRHPRVKLERMNADIDRIVASYPVQWNVQPFLVARCSLADRARSEQLVPALRRPVSGRVSAEDAELYASCLSWLLQGEGFVMRYHRRGQAPETVVIE
ncbi:hypothetical protein ACNI65_23095 [Roseateles sp. So40a]|uniref:hypothetical protein n=1 Tax=Roseateles sp. So40a TaxID=3400226 RepID=UPI003A838BBC